MKKDDLFKKTQDTAQNLLEKGKDLVQDLMEKAEDAGLNEKFNELKGNVVDKTKDLKENLEKSDVAKNTKETVQSFIDKVSENFKEIKKNSEEKKDNAISNARDNMQNLSSIVNENIINKKDTKAMTREELKAGKGGKALASVAIGAAAVAGAYSLYINRKNQEEALKAEFSERMKKWHELEDGELEEDLKKGVKRMTVRNVKLYPKNSNALLGEDIIINITPFDEFHTFNPDKVSEEINPMEDVKKKAQDLAKMVQDRLVKLSEEMGNKAEEIKSNADNLVNDTGENVKNAKSFAKDAFNTAKEKVSETMKSAAKAAEELRDKNFEFEDDLKNKVDNISDEIKENVEDAKDKIEDVIENNLEGEDIMEDNIIPKEEKEEVKKSVFNPASRNMNIEDEMIKKMGNIKWEEEKKPYQKATEEIKNVALSGFEAFRKTLSNVKDQITNNVENAKKAAQDALNKEEEELNNEETVVSQFDVTIHNKGNKDYYFTPMLIQRFNSKNKTSLPCPRHEEGTTLEQRIIKPGETYTGRLFIRLAESDDALVIFEDMLMNGAAAILLNDDSKDDFIKAEDKDLVDEILFEDI